MNHEEFKAKMADLRYTAERKCENILCRRVDVFANFATVYADRENNNPRFNLDIRFGYDVDAEDQFFFRINPSCWGEFDPSKNWSDNVARYFLTVGFIVDRGPQLREVLEEFWFAAERLRKEAGVL